MRRRARLRDLDANVYSGVRSPSRTLQSLVSRRWSGVAIIVINDAFCDACVGFFWCTCWRVIRVATDYFTIVFAYFLFSLSISLSMTSLFIS